MESFEDEGSRAINVWVIQNKKMLWERDCGPLSQIAFLDIDCRLWFYSCSMCVYLMVTYLYPSSLYFLRFMFIFTLCVQLFACMHVPWAYLVFTEEGVRSGTGVIGSCEPPYGFWELNSALSH